jgi:hypothetical protein
VPGGMLRVAYFSLLLADGELPGVTVECAELGVCVHGAPRPGRAREWALLFIHEVFYPIFVTAFSGLVFNW